MLMSEWMQPAQFCDTLPNRSNTRESQPDHEPHQR